MGLRWTCPSYHYEPAADRLYYTETDYIDFDSRDGDAVIACEGERAAVEDCWIPAGNRVGIRLYKGGCRIINNRVDYTLNAYAAAGSYAVLGEYNAVAPLVAFNVIVGNICVGTGGVGLMSFDTSAGQIPGAVGVRYVAGTTVTYSRESANLADYIERT